MSHHPPRHADQRGGLYRQDGVEVGASISAAVSGVRPDGVTEVLILRDHAVLARRDVLFRTVRGGSGPAFAAPFLGDYLGVKATGKPINMRVMDWWRNDGTLLTENWVMIDLPHLMLQMDVDSLARLRD